VRSIGKSKTVHALAIEKSKEGEIPKVMTTTPVYYSTDGNASRCLDSPVYDLNDLKGGMFINGPSIILNQTSTILVEPGCQAEIDNYGNVIIQVVASSNRQEEYS
jgi:5-oxoprolinase (ATP-hydrolysing)